MTLTLHVGDFMIIKFKCKSTKIEQFVTQFRDRVALECSFVRMGDGVLCAVRMSSPHHLLLYFSLRRHKFIYTDDPPRERTDFILWDKGFGGGRLEHLFHESSGCGAINIQLFAIESAAQRYRFTPLK